MCDDFDTDINHYTVTELFEIIGLDHSASNQKLIEQLDMIINKYTSKNKSIYSDFFRKVKFKLLNSYLDNNTSSSSLIEGFHDEVNPETDNGDTEESSIIEEENTSDIITGDIEMYPTFNKLERTITNRTIIIDSQYRPLTEPFSDDPNDETCPTHFVCNLTDKIKNTVSIRLHSINIPRTWYSIDSYLQNDKFWIFFFDNKDSSGTKSTERKLVDKVLITIDEGNYTPDNLVNEINRKLEEAGINNPGEDNDYTNSLFVRFEQEYRSDRKIEFVSTLVGPYKRLESETQYVTNSIEVDPSFSDYMDASFSDVYSAGTAVFIYFYLKHLFYIFS